MSKTRWARLAVPVAILLLYSACGGASVDDRRSWPANIGAKRVYMQACPAVMEAGKKALAASELDFEAEEPFGTGHAVYAEAGPFFMRQGEVVRVVFEEVSSTKCRVYLSSQAKISANEVIKSADEYALEYFPALDTNLKAEKLEGKYDDLDDEEEPDTQGGPATEDSPETTPPEGTGGESP